VKSEVLFGYGRGGIRASPRRGGQHCALPLPVRPDGAQGANGLTRLITVIANTARSRRYFVVGRQRRTCPRNELHPRRGPGMVWEIPGPLTSPRTYPGIKIPDQEMKSSRLTAPLSATPSTASETTPCAPSRNDLLGVSSAVTRDPADRSPARWLCRLHRARPPSSGAAARQPTPDPQQGGLSPRET
jgi:hypothetical protein